MYFLKPLFSYTKYSYKVPDSLSFHQYKCLKNLAINKRQELANKTTNKSGYWLLFLKLFFSLLILSTLIYTYSSANSNKVFKFITVAAIIASVVLNINILKSIKSYINSGAKIKLFFSSLEKLLIEADNYDEFCTLYQKKILEKGDN